MRWYAQVNDVVGGWIVTNVNLPLARQDVREDGDGPRGYTFAECMTEEDAVTLARYLTWGHVKRPLIEGVDG